MGKTKTDGAAKTVTIRVPISIRHRGGRKVVLSPQGSAIAPAASGREVDNAMVKAIARAFRWREMLENGTHATIAEIAAAEQINESYVGRVLRLTLLSPSIVETILGGNQSESCCLPLLMRRFPIEWDRQPHALMR